MESIIAKYPQDQVFVVTDEHVEQHLMMLGLSTFPSLVLSAGEEHKTLAAVERIWQFLLEHGATRSALLINVGGGVMSDLGGFAAATYKRGIDYINVPTTLLSMVDAAAGGKTGFDYEHVKNAIGAFHAPIHIAIDTRVLATLSGRNLLSGLAEMIKHALIAAPEELPILLAMDADSDFTSEAFDRCIQRSIAIKERIVAEDPKDQGLRRILNFGHTIGHAIEALSVEHGQPLEHGYAVMYGIIAELYLSHVLLGLDKQVVSQLATYMVTTYGRIHVSCKQYDRLIALMRQDKKNTTAEAICFTLLKQTGEPVFDQIAQENLIREALDYLFSV